MKITIFCVMLLPCITVSAQITFEKTYGGVNDDEGNSVIQTSDGGYLIAGYTKSFGVSQDDVYLVKTAAQGDTMWTRNYGHLSYDRADAVVETADGNFLVAGTAWISGKGYEVFLLKVDADGDTLWTKTCGGLMHQHIYDMIPTFDGGYALCGIWDPGYYDFYLLKINSDGDSLWSNHYGGSSGSANDIAYAVKQTADSGFVLAGRGPEGGKAIFVVKTDSLGQQTWARHYDGNEAYDIVQTPDNGYLVVGGYYATSERGDDIYLIRIAVNGDTLWTKLYDFSTFDVARGVVNTDDGFMITGYAGGLDVGSRDVFIMKNDTLGDSLWIHGFGSTSADMGLDIIPTLDGGYVITGYREGYPVSARDVFLVKTDAEGILSSLHTPSSSPSFNYTLYQNYPNPFNPQTTVTFELPRAEGVTVSVYNVAGQKIRELFKGKKTHGVHSLTWDATGLASGIYLIRLDAEQISVIRKCVFLK